MALVAASWAGGVIPGTTGCVLRSVDKGDYVAENEAVFFTIRIPRYLREARTTSYSIGTPARHACLPHENGPPYESFTTWHVFTPGPGQTPLGFDRRMLGREWISDIGGPNEEAFHRGPASLYVHYTAEETSFGVDYRGNERSR
jgi:hypothetical protein